MGFLTTFSVYNDGVDQIKSNPQEFADAIYEACTDNSNRKHIGLGGFANLITPQLTRHADNNTTYVHMGNTVVEMNACSKKTIDLAENHPEFFDDLLQHMEETVKDLKELKKKQLQKEK